MAHLHYLTVQDVIWLHLQITNKVQPYDYARLEEAVFYQYAYGDSTGLLPQAGRFVSGFMRKAPFGVGDDQTAFLALAAFLGLNGKRLKVEPAESAAFIASAKASRPQLESKAGDAPADEHLDPRSALKSALERYSPAAVAI